MAHTRYPHAMVVACVLCALAAGCQQAVKHEEVIGGDRINLRVRLLDVSTYHLDAYSDFIPNIDALVMTPQAGNTLAAIFAEVSTDLRYPDNDIDVVIKVTTERQGATGQALAELQVSKGYEADILVEETATAVYEGTGDETNGEIRNNAALRAMEAVIRNLSENPVLLDYAQLMTGRAKVVVQPPATQPATQEKVVVESPTTQPTAQESR